MKLFRFSPALLKTSRFDIADILILLVLLSMVYVGVRVSTHAPSVITGPDISLSFTALPWYAMLSVGRMLIAYLLSLAFTLAYGYVAARNRTAEKLMMPLLDVLQSVPILSFLPVVLLSLSVILPQNIAAELAAIVLIFTSQAWNMTYSFFQSVSTVPHELKEAAAIFRLSPWLRFRKVELPFSALGLIWNSMMSWAGGWFFLMASEIFSVGPRDFRLPGIGAYLQTAAGAGDIHSVLAGIAVLVLTIVLLDRLLWHPILCWAEKFKVEMVAGETIPQSVVRDLLSRSWIITRLSSGILSPCMEWLDSRIIRKGAEGSELLAETGGLKTARLLRILGALAGIIGLLGIHRIVRMMIVLRPEDWITIGLGTLATLLRVSAALIIALAWTVPVGVAIGTNRRMAGILQPIVQVAASIPATALFPVIVMILVRMPGGLNIAAITLMLLGTQWYLLFNVIAGTAAIPQDLRDTTALLRLSRRDRWRNLILPSLFPYLVTGAITAGGGAWNASIVAEHAQFGGQTISTPGIGSLIAGATGSGNYPLLLASTLALILTVVTINRLFWRRLYTIAETKYRME
jgi:NitT/TauT family transport system permease protein